MQTEFPAVFHFNGAFVGSNPGFSLFSFPPALSPIAIIADIKKKFFMQAETEVVTLNPQLRFNASFIHTLNGLLIASSLNEIFNLISKVGNIFIALSK